MYHHWQSHLYCISVYTAHTVCLFFISMWLHFFNMFKIKIQFKFKYSNQLSINCNNLFLALCTIAHTCCYCACHDTIVRTVCLSILFTLRGKNITRCPIPCMHTSLANNADSHFDSEYVFTKYNLMSWYWLYARSLLHMIQSSTHHFSVCILAGMNQDVCVCDCVCFCICVNEFELVVCRFQPLMTFACCCCEQSDPAVLIKTNGTDHSPLIVFH